MALTDKLTAIGNSIRAKTGKSGTLTLDNMVSEINALEVAELTVYTGANPDSSVGENGDIYLVLE